MPATGMKGCSTAATKAEVRERPMMKPEENEWEVGGGAGRKDGIFTDNIDERAEAKQKQPFPDVDDKTRYTLQEWQCNGRQTSGRTWCKWGRRGGWDVWRGLR